MADKMSCRTRRCKEGSTPSRNGSYLVELDAPVFDDNPPIQNPMYVVLIRDEIVPQVWRVIVQNIFDGREATNSNC